MGKATAWLKCAAYYIQKVILRNYYSVFFTVNIYLKSLKTEYVTDSLDENQCGTEFFIFIRTHSKVQLRGIV